jgi:translation machinery-associated protein 16
MPAKSFTKVQKHITKKKGKNAALHEHSRDSKRLQRASGRDTKLAKTIAVREKQNAPHCRASFSAISMTRLTAL